MSKKNYNKRWSADEMTTLLATVSGSSTTYKGCKKASVLLGRTLGTCLTKYYRNQRIQDRTSTFISTRVSNRAVKSEINPDSSTIKVSRKRKSTSVLNKPAVQGLNSFKFKIKSYTLKGNHLIINI